LTTQRLSCIDALKGIAILLVVLGHSFVGSKPFPPVTPYNLFNFVYAVHMPLFFFLSGYVFNFPKYFNRFFDLVKSRFRSLILPWIYFSILLVFMSSLLSGFTWTRFMPVINLSYYWFLPCLFLVEILYYLLSKYLYMNNKIILLGFVVLLGLSETRIPFQYYPWFTLKIALVALLFYYIGNLMRDEVHIDNTSSLFIGGECAAIFLIFGGLNYKAIEISTASMSYYFTYCSVAIAGILALFLGCKLAYEHNHKSRILEFFGVNCITLFLLQNFILTFLGKGIPSLFDGDHVYLIAILTVLFAVPCILAINRYAPFLIGRRRENHNQIK
jgi:acyltransferase